MIGTIEQSIIDYLQRINDSGALGYRLRQIKSYGGELKDQAARAKIKDYPALWIAYNGSPKPTQRHGTHNVRINNFVILIATKSLRNESMARLGGAGEVGAYQMIADIEGILAGFKPEGAMTGIEIGSITPLSVEDKGNQMAAVYGMNLSVNHGAQRTFHEVDLTNPLQEIHTNWDLPPIKTVGETLPDDENADATTHITGDS